MLLRHFFILLPVLLFPLSNGALARPNNEIPMYGGGGPYPPDVAAANEEFLAAIAQRGLTRPQGSDNMVQLGWRYYFERQDVTTAMKRFNQAWLLDPDNGDAFDGFAVLIMARDHDAAQADSLFQQGLAKPRQSPGIYLDYGRFLLTVNRPVDAVAPLRHAVAVPDMGPDAQALLTLALYQSGDMAAACAERAKVLDGAQPVIRDAARNLEGCRT
jgi:Tfp pilus assembly protein PilF